MKDKVVLITGASRGIGRATAIQFAEAGALVIVNYRDNEAAANLTLSMMKGENNLTIKADVSHRQQLEMMVKRVIEKYGRIDVLVNNAGVFYPHKIDEVTLDEWENAWIKTININLLGLANLTYLVAQHMIKQNSGHIINVSSRGAFRGEPDFPAYGASKGGLNSMSQSLAKALGKYNISVTAVAPGFVETDMAQETLDSPVGEFLKSESPMGRVARPEEVANVILFLAKEESLFMTGGIVDINGASFLRM